jgi:hypothetical protein
VTISSRRMSVGAIHSISPGPISSFRCWAACVSLLRSKEAASAAGICHSLATPRTVASTISHCCSAGRCSASLHSRSRIENTGGYLRLARRAHRRTTRLRQLAVRAPAAPHARLAVSRRPRATTSLSHVRGILQSASGTRGLAPVLLQRMSQELSKESFLDGSC